MQPLMVGAFSVIQGAVTTVLVKESDEEAESREQREEEKRGGRVNYVRLRFHRMRSEAWSERRKEGEERKVETKGGRKDPRQLDGE